MSCSESELNVSDCDCSVEVILRAEAVETAQAGDRCDFVGSLIVVPDVGSMSMPGELLKLSLCCALNEHWTVSELITNCCFTCVGLLTVTSCLFN